MDPAAYAVQREYQWRFIKGMSAEVFVALWDKQQGKCAVCRAELLFVQRDVGVVVDHSHASGHVRGLLCQGCNKGLGYFQDNENLLLAAIEYLRNPPIKPVP